MRRIAREAGISKALLYHYFPSKQRFFVATLSQAAEEVTRRTEPDPELPPAEALSVSLDAFLAWVEENAGPPAGATRAPPAPGGPGGSGTGGGPHRGANPGGPGGRDPGGGGRGGGGARASGGGQQLARAPEPDPGGGGGGGGAGAGPGGGGGGGGGRGGRSRARPAGRARRRALARRRPRLRAADGARVAAVPDRLAPRRADRPRRAGARGRLLHRAAGQRRLSLRRARAGEVVRRRHRPEVRASTSTSSGACGAQRRRCGWSARAIRRCIASASASSSPCRGIARWTT